MKILLVIGLFNSGSTATMQLLSRLKASAPGPMFQDKMENADLRKIMADHWMKDPLGASDERVNLQEQFVEFFQDLLTKINNAGGLEKAPVLAFKCPIMALWIVDILDALDLVMPEFGFSPERDVKILICNRRIEDSKAGLRHRQWFPRSDEIQDRISDRISEIIPCPPCPENPVPMNGFLGRDVNIVDWDGTLNDPIGTCQSLKTIYGLRGDPIYAAGAIDKSRSPA